ncbi:sensor histidine kinase [Nocardioides rubriscoriae]|uniref:sensor histidine kinase n=1 Tax=Nocardioides rubriscoriae TaxID=642762 RepID=UPI0011E0427B|nr:histidine kinase [Nocardioides rubriscoriae]
MEDRLRAWVPSVALGLAVLVLGVVELVNTDAVNGSTGSRGLAVLVLATAVAATLSRRAPAGALALSGAIGIAQVATDTQVMLVEAAFFVVVFCSARWGSVATVVGAALSVPVAAATAVYLVAAQEYVPLLSVVDLRTLLDTAYRFGDTWRVGASVVTMLVLAAPWLAGLALRFSDRARRSQASQERAEEQAAVAVRQTEQAREIARLRDEQARLARDVHDVVGHSLAVILAQAESAQYLPDDDPERLKQTMATIASSARSSLQDVRHVLSAPDAPATTRPLDTLVDGVRAGGHEVVLRELGTARPLPPELETTAYRVLQEMLTNAVKHGRRDAPVLVERHWPDDSLSDELRVEVRNTVDAQGAVAPGTRDTRGSGLDGMRQRLEAVGGRIDVRRREEDDATTTFTVTAWIPLGSR